MKGLKEFAKKFESLMTATAFAEAGEFKAAREVLKEETQPGEKTVKKSGRGYTPDLAVNAAGNK
jgi:hypothetical protein